MPQCPHVHLLLHLLQHHILYKSYDQRPPVISIHTRSIGTCLPSELDTLHLCALHEFELEPASDRGAEVWQRTLGGVSTCDCTAQTLQVKCPFSSPLGTSVPVQQTGQTDILAGAYRLSREMSASQSPRRAATGLKHGPPAICCQSLRATIWAVVVEPLFGQRDRCSDSPSSAAIECSRGEKRTGQKV